MTGKTIRIKVDVSTDKIGSKVDDILDTEITVSEWAAMTEAERNSTCDEIYRDWMFEQVEGGWVLAEDAE